MKFSIKQNSGLLVFAFVNFVFAIKYGSRITPHFVLLGFAISAVYVAIWHWREPIGKLLAKYKISNLVLLVVFVLAAAIAFHKIPVASLRVDRYDIINAFWENYFNGDYVYYAKSFDNNYPGPMPFYFILALPFYLIGELGIFSLLGVFAFTQLLKKSAMANVMVLLTVLSTAYLWEVCTRSNIFTNAALVLASMVWFLKRYDGTKRSDIVFGIVFGLLLSTRNVFAIPYIVLFVFALRQRRIGFVNLLILGSVASVSFALTFVPFVLGHVDDFAKVNPFVIQSSVLMPLYLSLVFVALAFASGFVCRDQNDVFYYSALVLLITILGYIFHLSLSFGWKQMLFDSVADISYLILCVPFALFHLYLCYENALSDLEK